jgi:5-histidylcysteine sulfoxide synthase
LQEYFENAYNLDELLFSAITDEQYLYKCPDRLRLPLIFYLAHPATLYVNKLLLAALISERVNPSFEAMFETGVDEMCWDDTENYRMGRAYLWPGLSEVMEYRRTVRQLVSDVISSAPLSLPVSMDSPWWSVCMSLEHERIHLETSSVLIRQLPVEFVERPRNWKYAPLSMDTRAGENVFVKVPAGRVTIGKPRDFPSYGWDNEYGKAEIDVPEFEASQYLVTNGEFLEFVESGGYSNRDLWTEEGWKWVEFRGARHPTFWVCSEGCRSGCGGDLSSHSHCSLPSPQNGAPTYQYRAMFDVVSMPEDWPVEVNYHEAKAFCHWKGPSFRVLTEAEHHRIRDDPPLSSDVSCDPAFRADLRANTNLRYCSPSPVNMFPANSLGFHDVYGNVWEWLEDQFNGLPGFKTHYLYDDFSSTYCDGKHNLMAGGSWASSGSFTSRFCRNFFRRHFFQHCGFRLARSVSSPPPVRLCRAIVFVLGEGVTDTFMGLEGLDEKTMVTETANRQYVYETKASLDQTLQEQYGEMESHAVPLVEKVEEAVGRYNGYTGSVVNFGCATGLTSFLLSTTFEKVVGIDFCGRFIDAAMRIQEGKVIHYDAHKVAKLPSQSNPAKVKFKQLTWVPNKLEGFDVAVFEGVERLSEPRGWLNKLWEVVVPGGLLVFSSSSSLWDSSSLPPLLGEWFTVKKTLVIGGRQVSVWKMSDVD